MSSGLWIPKHLRKKHSVVFWLNKLRDHLMVPASPIAPAPVGYERIECTTAQEIDKWSAKLRAQERRFHEMTMQERFDYEDPIRLDMMNELKARYQAAIDPVNREFLARAIDKISADREARRKETIESYMHCEGFENVAK